MTLYAVVNGNQLNAVPTTTFTQEAIFKLKYLQPHSMTHIFSNRAAVKFLF